mgnify:CR=1 FL=1
MYVEINKRAIEGQFFSVFLETWRAPMRRACHVRDGKTRGRLIVRANRDTDFHQRRTEAVHTTNR